MEEEQQQELQAMNLEQLMEEAMKKQRKQRKQLTVASRENKSDMEVT
jgi:hypothetical protein